MLIILNSNLKYSQGHNINFQVNTFIIAVLYSIYTKKKNVFVEHCTIMIYDV